MGKKKRAGESAQSGEKTAPGGMIAEFSGRLGGRILVSERGEVGRENTLGEKHPFLNTFNIILNNNTDYYEIDRKEKKEGVDYYSSGTKAIPVLTPEKGKGGKGKPR